MYIAPYEVAFIETLNAYKTLSSRPIEFSTNDITTLTSKCDDGESLNNRILTQIKFYRGLQEILCTNIALLKVALAENVFDLDYIADNVYCMIDMSYVGRYAVSAWLWKLHVQLLELKQNVLDREQKFLDEYIPEIEESLRKILTECRGNNYIVDDDNLKSDKFLEMYDRKSNQIFIADSYKSTLRIDVGNLLLDHLWWLARGYSDDITSLSFGWPNIYPVIKKEIDNLSDQYESGEWPKQPFKHIKLHKVLLDIIKARWYSHIFIILFVYQKIGSQAQRLFDTLIEIINEEVHFFHTDDPFFNDVLNILSELYTPEDEMLNTIIRKLEVEVNYIMGSVTEPNSDYGEPTIDLELITKASRNFKEPKFQANLVDRFRSFISDTERLMSGTNLSILMFYIRGSQFADFVFPNE
ncbi:uncharacterized protein LOC126842125 [Adelges cooleyi]|uniref:uncharacterized protein LOC126842125 n=1 Tax=Adelges cooleyi TaxID=133065 RepID=UPI00217FD59B|nr:uncharacterized protein LOC126842125 [Adelges cooleyi]